MLNTPYNILLSARDMAAALHLYEIYKYAQLHKPFSELLTINVVAQGAASRYFNQMGLPHQHIDLPAAKTLDSHEADKLLEMASQLIEHYKPDAILCGLSWPVSGGIDEALVAKFQGTTVAMQDFWGEVNCFFGKAADLHLVMDNNAVKISEARYDINTYVIGSPYHATYATLNVKATRIRERAKLNIKADETLYGFFGQGLHQLEGYRNTVEQFCDIAKTLPNTKILYKPHPRENEHEYAWTLATMKRFGIDPIITKALKPEYALISCDVVCSSFSNCTYDMAFLNYYSDFPLATPFSLFFDPEIVDYFQTIVKLSELPYIETGIADIATNVQMLETKLIAAAQYKVKHLVWTQAKNTLADPRLAAGNAWKAIINQIKNG